MTLECWQEVIKDYEKLLIDEGYDVIIYAGEIQNVKELHAHSLILRTRSQYFHKELTKKDVEKREGRFILKIPNISPHIINIILRFIYCGKIDFTSFEGPELLKLAVALDALEIQTLVPRIEEYLIKEQNEFLQLNPIEILEIIYQHESFTKLWNFYLEKICEDPKILFDSDKFISIKAPLLELLLKRDDLGLEEIDIWDSLIKWGFAQNLSVPNDVTKWSKEEGIMMERTLHRFIPLVRFYCVSSEEFLDKVLPFKKLLPKDLVKNLLAFYLAPNRKLNINEQMPRQNCVYSSKILNSQQFPILSSSIDKKNESHYNVKNMPYKFNLIYRASKDGMTQAAFHQKCDNKGATIVIIKIRGSEQLVGGYNPLVWDSSDTWKYAYDSFIFSFKNGNTFNFGYSNGGGNSIGCHSNYGPSFHNDLRLDKNGFWKSISRTYPDVGIPASFNVDNYEVFQVIKK